MDNDTRAVVFVLGAIIVAICAVVVSCVALTEYHIRSMAALGFEQAHAPGKESMIWVKVSKEQKNELE